jgi:release factor glutamine methyltransferase
VSSSGFSQAVRLASRNAEKLGLSSRYECRVCDIRDLADPGGFDAVVSNPPYIPEADMKALEPEVGACDP